MTFEIRLQRARCIGSKCCTHAAPGVFALDDQQVVTVVDPAGGTREQVQLAADECPTGAISVVDGDPPG
ncbi:MAG TPA: ferredoxin [Acidimicrobiales bacterium]|nr:ferredoxin [Acidimicrobiales bacterium]